MTTKYFDGRRVVVTGASSGIGLALARIVRSWGADVVMIARGAERLEAARSEVASIAARGKVETLSLDVGDAPAVAKALSGTRADVLINNAGITLPGRFGELPVEEFEREMRTNYLGGVYCTRALLPSLVQNRGHVAFTSSVLGYVGIYGYSAYSPTKFAQRAFAECLRCELKPLGVRVSVCYPPDTDTPQHTFELQYLPEETKRISGNAGLLSADEVARSMLTGMAAGRLEILPGNSWFIRKMNRHLPRVVQYFMDDDVKAARRERELMVGGDALPPGGG